MFIMITQLQMVLAVIAINQFHIVYSV